MASSTRSSRSSRKNARKGQFFILTAVAIVTILFFVGRWVDPLSQVDASSIAGADEFLAFDNIKEQASDAVKNSESCDDLEYNLQEYKTYIERFAQEKNYKIEFSYVPTPCEPELGTITEFTLRIISNNVDAEGTFSVAWP